MTPGREADMFSQKESGMDVEGGLEPEDIVGVEVQFQPAAADLETSDTGMTAKLKGFRADHRAALGNHFLIGDDVGHR